jgi:probable phosphoglycerate mutase
VPDTLHFPELVLVRHGETEWSAAGKHTGRTNVPLTARGRRQAEAISTRLQGRRFARVLTSPLDRAVETARLSGFGAGAEVSPDLPEWDYGEYEGRTTVEIRREVPGWSLWRDGGPAGETADEVGRRVDRVIATVRLEGGDTLLFAHGHVLRVLAARWLGLPAADGRLLKLDTGTVSVLGWEREVAVMTHWNDNTHLLGLMVGDDDNDRD